MNKAKSINSNFWERNRKSGGYLLKKKIKEWFIIICRFILLFGLCFLILQPILNKISVSFMTEDDLFDPTVINIPLHFTTRNYSISAEVLSLKESLTNSLVISITISLIQVAMCTLVGYGFARFKFPLKNFWFFCVILVIVIPPQTISSSLFVSFQAFDLFGIIKALNGGKGLNLSSNAVPYYLLGATCMGLKNGLYIYLIRQFFRNIPEDMEEAAYVDGCGTLKTFVKIMLPEAKPIITSCFLFSFVWAWTDGFYSKMFLARKFELVGVKLARVVDSLGAYLSNGNGTSTVSVAFSNCILSTSLLIIIIPLIVLYLFAQRSFVESLSSTGIKM